MWKPAIIFTSSLGIKQKKKKKRNNVKLVLFSRDHHYSLFIVFESTGHVRKT